MTLSADRPFDHFVLSSWTTPEHGTDGKLGELARQVMVTSKKNIPVLGREFIATQRDNYVLSLMASPTCVHFSGVGFGRLWQS